MDQGKPEKPQGIDTSSLEVNVTSELREKVREKDERLGELLETIRTKHPYLTDGKLPRPALIVSHPRQIQIWISESINDFAYVSRYPNGRVMSLRLAHEARSIPPKPGNERSR